MALVEVWQRSDAVLKASAYIEGLGASGRVVREVVYDRCDSAAKHCDLRPITASS